jgi:hypothetical protein
MIIRVQQAVARIERTEPGSSGNGTASVRKLARARPETLRSWNGGYQSIRTSDIYNDSNGRPLPA